MDDWQIKVLENYRQAFELLDKCICSIADRGITFTHEEVEMLKEAASKHKNMVYHIRKDQPDFQPPKL